MEISKTGLILLFVLIGLSGFAGVGVYTVAVSKGYLAVAMPYDSTDSRDQSIAPRARK